MYYGSIQGFVDYHEARGRTVHANWHDEFIAAALLVASEWIDSVYGKLFTGYPTGGYNQERQWPRTAAWAYINPIYNFPTNAIPKEVEYATYEAAWQQANSPESLSVNYTPNKYKKAAVDGAVSVEYAQFSSSADLQMQLTSVDRWLAILLNPHADLSPFSGATTRV